MKYRLPREAEGREKGSQDFFDDVVLGGLVQVAEKRSRYSSWALVHAAGLGSSLELAPGTVVLWICVRPRSSKNARRESRASEVLRSARPAALAGRALRSALRSPRRNG